MAVDSKTAFGRYIRTLRERRKLSLDDVQSLSRGSAEAINKGYLSRCENGHQSIAFTKIITLSRIYEIPVEVFAERLELDMELERVGGPETAGKSLEELAELGRHSYVVGAVWHIYAYFRDATMIALESPLRSAFTSKMEQFLIASMNTCTAAMKLGRSQYPLHELTFISNHRAVTSKHRHLVEDRLARVHRILGNLELSQDYSERAVVSGEEVESEYLYILYGNRGTIALDAGDFELAHEMFHKSYRVGKKTGNVQGCAIDLLHLGHAYFAAGRIGAARRSAESAERIARTHGIERSLGFAQILLGLVEAAEDRPSKAEELWRQAVAIGKRHNDRVLRFKAEVLLYEQAIENGAHGPARALERRLRRLAPWMPEGMRELAHFRELLEASSR